MFSIFSQLVFGNSNVFSGIGTGKAHGKSGSSNNSSAGSWKDKSICFDLRWSDLELDNGEQLIACYFPIEDIKGNQDEFGVLKVTNLRLIWICCEKRKINLSIGWRTVTFAFEQNLKDSLGSNMPSLCVLTRFESSKYEFVFNKMATNSANAWLDNYLLQSGNYSPDQYQSKFDLFFRLNQSKPTDIPMTHLTASYLAEPFEVVFRVWQAYKRTHLFRHCRSNLGHLISTSSHANSVLNSSQDSDKNQDHQKYGFKLSQLNKLPSEEVIDLYTGIVHVESKAVRYLGTLILSNIRLIWIDELIPVRNFSIPYIKIDSLKFKQTERIIINTLDYLATSDHLELRLQRQQQPQILPINNNTDNNNKQLRAIFDQIQDLCNLYKSAPKFGPESCDDCINYVTYLKPIERYFGLSGKVPLGVNTMENFGPEVHRTIPLKPGEVWQDDKNSSGSNYLSSKGSGEDVPIGGNYGEKSSGQLTGDVDETENELSRYAMTNYLDESWSVERDKKLIYSEKLGLMVEKPANKMDLARIWRIEVS